MGVLLKVQGTHVLEQLIRGKGWSIANDKKLGEQNVFYGKVQFDLSQPSFGGALDQHYIFMNYNQFENPKMTSEIGREVKEWNQYSKRLNKKAA